MKRVPLKKKQLLNSRKHKRGIALILVLACLVLLVVMVLAFLGSIGTELRSSKFYANGSSVKLLAQSTTDLVMAEIRDATANGALCWASQPGMIRTYDNTGNVVSYYKLYSDDTMITGTFDHTKALVPDGIATVNGSRIAWYNQQGVYVDLNEPIYLNGTTQYPIVDGSPGDYITGAIISTAAGATKVKTLTTITPLIQKPAATATVNVPAPITASAPAVLGFWLNSNTPYQAKSINYAPMPVKWLYVLKDGSLAVPDTATTATSTVTFANSAAQPRQDNPIVGRMAFWTDDETCKVNINTASTGVSSIGVSSTIYSPASTGTYWAPPFGIDTANGTSTNTYNSASDIYLGRFIPVNHEYQRYPGHPATTSLNTIFSSLTGTLGESMFSITPRLGPGGSVEGTFKTTQGGTNAITLNSNRLYSTVDEYLFQPGLNGSTASSTRQLNSAIANAPSITGTLIRQARFLLTANSRAPDVNVFNQPRVGMWPLSSNTGSTYRTPFDQLIAFCGQVGKDGSGNPFIYYFQRSNPNSTIIDLPVSASTSGLGRNRMLMNYLTYLTAQQIPGFGGSLAKKYNTSNSTGNGTDINQILTEIFDYIRCTNLEDPAFATTGNPFTPPGTGSGQVAPIVDSATGTRGFGRMATVEGGAFQFIANADSTTNPTLTGSIVPKDALTGTIPVPVANGKVRVQAAFLPQLITVSPGSPYIYHNFTLLITGLNQFTLGGVSLGYPATLTKNISYSSGNTPDHECWGDAFGLTAFRENNSLLVSSSIDIPSGTTAFSGGDVTIYILQQGVTDPLNAYQKISLHFPAIAAMPTPTVFKNFDSSLPVTDPLSATGTFVSTAYISNWNYDTTVNKSYGNYFNMRQFAYEATGTTVTMGGTINGSGTYTQTASGTTNYKFHGRWTDGAGDTYGVSSASMFIENPVSTSTSGSVTTTGSGKDVVRAVGAYDARLVAAQVAPDAYTVPDYAFTTVGSYSSSTSYTAGNHTFWTGDGRQYFGANGGVLARNLNIDTGGAGGVVYTSQYSGNRINLYHWWGGGLASNNCTDVPLNGTTCGTTTAFTAAAGQVTGDWDNGIGPTRDGPFINKPDEGDSGGSNVPYNWKGDTGNSVVPVGNFSPNRMIASPGVLGSLPTGVFAGRPFQTLLFRPGPMGHPGLGTSTTLTLSGTIAGGDQGPPYTTQASTSAIVQGPPDHLFLDLFNMPVVEPYAISEPLSTAGRINMNHLIVPFTYINRDTGLRSLLIDEKVIAASDAQALNYKNGGSTYGAQTPMRFPVNMDATLSQFFSRRFNNNDIFRSPSEICEIDIVPDDASRITTWDPGKRFAADFCSVGGGTIPTNAAPTRSAAIATSTNPYPGMDTYWNWSNVTPGNTTIAGNVYSITQGHRVTGDNSRERIYTTLYPRLTTKSNTYTIHFRVQTLQPIKSTTTNWATWREGVDAITSEYRGSQTIERYVDPNDSTIPDFTANPSTTQSLAPYYHFRVLSTKQFSP